MSATPKATARLTAPAIQARKGGEPLVVLTAYTAPIARLLDAHCDILLVGDSLGMVVYGMETTLGVTLEMMALHAKAVATHSSHAMVVVDMPFGSFEASPEEAFKNAAYLLAESGAQAVKLEGGEYMADTIAFLTARGIPVMGHIGLTPTHVHKMGGFKAQARDAGGRAQLLADALAVDAAGAFSIVLEGVFADSVGDVVNRTSAPIIGIGATAECDGQVLVTDDMLGLTERAPRFAKDYAGLSAIIQQAAEQFAQDVKGRRFPTEGNLFGLKAASKA
ncbi:3-methyl-2-oxobutanoate hydroxymethyltransferase [bacterium]|nr:3-methyl-2-oxobutanoate hydroxymethyltransferase [bacterium]